MVKFISIQRSPLSTPGGNETLGYVLLETTTGSGVLVGSGLDVGVGVDVAVIDGVNVGVGVSVNVGVSDGVRVFVGVGVNVDLLISSLASDMAFKGEVAKEMVGVPNQRNVPIEKNKISNVQGKSAGRNRVNVAKVISLDII